MKFAVIMLNSKISFLITVLCYNNNLVQKYSALLFFHVLDIKRNIIRAKSCANMINLFG